MSQYKPDKAVRLRPRERSPPYRGLREAQSSERLSIDQWNHDGQSRRHHRRRGQHNHAARPFSAKKRWVSASDGKTLEVAPSSVPILAITCLSIALKVATPGP